MKKFTIIFLCLFVSLSFADAKSGYKIVQKIKIEGDAGWDLLTMDESTGRLFVSHGNLMQVLDVKTGKMISTISDLKGVHGIALAPEFNKGFITCGKDTSVIIFSLDTYKVLDKIKSTGINPDAILYDSFSKKVFVYNAKSSDATVLDAKSNIVLETIKLDGKPELSVADGHGKVYVNIENKNEISKINSITLKVEQTWSIKPGDGPSGLAIDKITHRLFSVTDSLMIIMDAETGKIITTLPIGDKVDGVAFDPFLKRAYSSNGDGTITVVKEINANRFEVIETILTQKGARTIAVDANTHHLYLPTAEYGETPIATKDNPRPRPSIKPGTFVILDVQPTNY